ncbi:hypothetical protein Tco_1079530 [Tanacetum coccineum]|uniref:Uncharacterized protein n=1 Tax=Tanacetum coccineum TaxID=301880 RepID=A0ABQ5HS45_9ASTR
MDFANLFYRNPYSRRFDEYKQVFDNEVEQLSNEYTLRIGIKGYVLDDVWEKCEQYHRKSIDSWYDDGFKEDELWQCGDEKIDYEREREREKDKACAELEMRCNDALQDLDKNPLVLDMREEIETLQGKVDRLHGEYSRLVLEEKNWVNYEQTLDILHSKVEGLESERERLKKSKTQQLQEIDGLRQDRAAVVAKVMPCVVMKLVRSDEIVLLVTRLAKAALFHGRCSALEEVAALKEPFELEKMPGYCPLFKKEFDQAGDNLAAASYSFLAEVTVDPYAPLEVLLLKKPKSL